MRGQDEGGGAREHVVGGGGGGGGAAAISSQIHVTYQLHNCCIWNRDVDDLVTVVSGTYSNAVTVSVTQR